MVYVHEIHGMIHVHMNVKDPLSQVNVVLVVSHLQNNRCFQGVYIYIYCAPTEIVDCSGLVDSGGGG